MNSITGDYDMNYWPHGIALIINNIRFESSEKRDGAELDEQNLVTLFRYLGYIVEVHRDCKADTICDIMKEMKKRDHSKYDSFVCCLMSHGSKGKIAGTDNKNVNIDEISTHLNGDECESLAGKPKMFFIQACRGDSHDYGVLISSGGDSRVWVDSVTKIPKEADFLFGFATSSGYRACRVNAGSWYITELCISLSSYARYADLDSMLKDTSNKVGREYPTQTQVPKYKEAPEYTSRLTKSVLFFP